MSRPRAMSRLPLLDVVAYSLPAASLGYLSLLLTIYFFKYATDVLLIAPAVVGGLFLVARAWDAVSDPLAGYLSDRTRSRMGRRRPWLLASAIPLPLVAVLPWIPPTSLGGAVLLTWVIGSVLLFETAATAFAVPHQALGAELSLDHHERTRIFGFRHAGTGLGLVLVAAAIHVMTTSQDKRAAALFLNLAGGIASTALIVLAVVRLRERAEHLGRGSRGPLHALRDVWRNRHARLLLAVFLIESVGGAALGVLGAYLTQYVLGDESLFPRLLMGYFVPSLLFIPVALRLSRRLGKKRTWMAGMLLTSASFGLLFFASPDALWLVYVAAAGAGVGGAVGSTVGPSVQADVIDCDEYATGERKEGTYFAVWNFIRKCGAGLTGWLTGVVLQVVGFEPNAEQSDMALLAIRALAGIFPFAAYACGALLFARFDLSEAEHRRIRAELDARATSDLRHPRDEN